MSSSSGGARSGTEGAAARAQFCRLPGVGENAVTLFKGRRTAISNLARVCTLGTFLYLRLMKWIIFTTATGKTGYLDGHREKNGPELVCAGLKVCPAKLLSHLAANVVPVPNISHR